MVGGVTMVCDHRISAESALCCSSKDFLADRRSQPIEKL
jgi:hypothetical protein